MTEISMERTDRTLVRLDLTRASGWTTFARLRELVAECEARGAVDSTPVVVANLGQALLGGIHYGPIIAVNIDHRAPLTDATPVALAADRKEG